MADFLSPISAAVGGAFGLIGAKQQFEYNKQLSSLQNQYNIDMWKMQADYNSPASQMQRFKQAGINPYLAVGNISGGNMTSAPEQVTPPAPDYSPGMSKLANIFNIEGLLTARANRKKAQAEARLAATEANERAFDFQGKLDFSNNYYYDTNKGTYVFSPIGGDTAINLPAAQRWYGNKLYQSSYLLPYRKSLIEHQRNYLIPQIAMANYENEHYPITYWVGTAGKGVKAVSDLTGVFNPTRYLMPIGKNRNKFLAPNGKVYNF